MFKVLTIVKANRLVGTTPPCSHYYSNKNAYEKMNVLNLDVLHETDKAECILCSLLLELELALSLMKITVFFRTGWGHIK